MSTSSGKSHSHKGSGNVVRPMGVRILCHQFPDGFLDNPNGSLHLPISLTVKHSYTAMLNPQTSANIRKHALKLSAIISPDPGWFTPATNNVPPQELGSTPRPFVLDGQGLHPLSEGVHSNYEVLASLIIRRERPRQIYGPPLKGCYSLIRVLQSLIGGSRLSGQLASGAGFENLSRHGSHTRPPIPLPNLCQQPFPT